MSRISLAIYVFMLSIHSLSGQTKHVVYTPSTEDFVNPERGFYHYHRTFSTPYSLLNLQDLISDRSEHKASSSTYTLFSSLVYRFYVLRDFKTSPLSQDFLNNFESDFNIARTAGVKLILRFCYTETAKTNPPYGDAAKDIVLTHIQQLAPILAANKDVIAFVQLGFIGIWGEGYYTDFFGDASRPPYLITEQNWKDRNEVLQAMLKAVPKDRMVQTRTPQMKQRFVNGIHAPTSSTPLMIDQAFSMSDSARIGHHNDCFLASADDFGTYANYGPDDHGSDTLNLKPYVALDSRFTPVGGETCSGFNPHDDCNSVGGNAEDEMRRFHYSYLNADYNNGAVNNQWKTQGCIDEIKQKLGYRFVLHEGEFTSEAKPGDPITIQLQLRNQGYAGLYNPRNIEIILIDRLSSASYISKIKNIDPRYWFPDLTIRLSIDLCLPNDIPEGTYDYFIRLPDVDSTLSNRPEYAIRLANQDVWQASLGINALNADLTIQGQNSGESCSGEYFFEKKNILNNRSKFSFHSIEIYPNPVKDIVKLSLPSQLNITNGFLEIVNIAGQRVYSKSIKQNLKELDLTELPSGVFVLRLISNNHVYQSHLIKI